MTAGGVHLWESREDAERLYTAEWKSFIREKYGAEPTVAYFDCPVVVDNVAGPITSSWTAYRHAMPRMGYG